MSHKVVLDAEAAREAEEAYPYIARRAPDAAARWYDRLLEAMWSLAEFPRRHPLAPEDAFFPEEIRHLEYGNYRVLYTIQDAPKVVRILPVRHAARRALGEPGSE